MDEVEETWDVLRALQILYRDVSHIWRKNLTTFEHLTPTGRVVWWRRAKHQAGLGAPAMQTLLLKVIELRLTR